MSNRWVTNVVGDLGDKKRYLAYKKRVAQLPDAYRAAAKGLERYLMYLGPSDDGASLIAMLNDLADLLEQSAAAQTQIRDIVGDDPADFADTFMENYEGGSWIRKERRRLAEAITRADDQSRRPAGQRREP